MAPTITAPHNALAVYVGVEDATRTLTYPFAEGADIPRQIQKDDTTFTLRSVSYNVDVASIDATQARIRDWNAKLFGGKAA